MIDVQAGHDYAFAVGKLLMLCIISPAVVLTGLRLIRSYIMGERF